MELQVEEILKSLREQIGNQAQEIAILKAALVKKELPEPTITTAVTDKPNVVGTQGIKANL